MTSVLSGSAEAAAELGHDIQPIFNKAGLNAGTTGSSKVFVAPQKVASALELAASEFDCPHFGFLVGKHQPALDFGPAGQVVKLAPTFQDMLGNIQRFIKIYTDTSGHEVTIGNGSAIIERLNRTTSYESTSIQFRTLGVVQLFKTCKAFCGPKWNITSVHFSFDAPPQSRLYSRYFNCPAIFNSEFSGIVIPEQLLYLKNPNPDPALYTIVLDYCERLLESRLSATSKDTCDSVRYFIRKHVGTNRCNLTACASKFDVHPRSLQRELAQAGSSFKALVLEERMALARDYLQHSKISITGIAETLGYKNTSNFSRVFAAHHACAPQKWRSEHGAD